MVAALTELERDDLARHAGQESRQKRRDSRSGCHSPQYRNIADEIKTELDNKDCRVDSACLTRTGWRRWRWR